MSKIKNELDESGTVDTQAKLGLFLKSVGQELPKYGALKIVIHEGKIAYITKEEKIRIS